MMALDPKRDIVVATGNPHKVEEIQAILQDVLPEVRFHILSDLGDFEDPEETGTTFVENAVIKAQAAVDALGISAIADDSGLVVDALGGEPGIYSARYAGEHGNSKKNNEKLLSRMEGIDNRRAHFHTTVVLITPDGDVLHAEGQCFGTIAHDTKGQAGFGYDPLFIPDEMDGRRMAELSAEEKNHISHRYHALKNLAKMLKDYTETI